MNYSFHPDAEKELEDAENYYDAIETALGNRFRAEFRSKLETHTPVSERMAAALEKYSST